MNRIQLSNLPLAGSESPLEEVRDQQLSNIFGGDTQENTTFGGNDSNGQEQDDYQTRRDREEQKRVNEQGLETLVPLGVGVVGGAAVIIEEGTRKNAEAGVYDHENKVFQGTFPPY